MIRSHNNVTSIEKIIPCSKSSSLISRGIEDKRYSSYKKKTNKKYTYENTYEGFSIQTNKEKGYGSIMSIDDAILKRFIYMIHQHSKVKPIRLDLHFPLSDNFTFNPNERYIRKFIKNMIERCDRLNTDQKNKYEIQILWVIEKDTSKHPHYHVLILANGNAIIDNGIIWNMAKEVWRNILKEYYTDGLIHITTGVKNILKLRKDVELDHTTSQGNLSLIRLDKGYEWFRLAFDNLMYYASYLAKIATKFQCKKGDRVYHGTRIPKDFTLDLSRLRKRVGNLFSLDLMTRLFPPDQYTWRG